MIHILKFLILFLGVLVFFVFKTTDTAACTADSCHGVHCDAPASCPEHETFACTECCCCLVCVPEIRKLHYLQIILFCLRVF